MHHTPMRSQTQSKLRHQFFTFKCFFSSTTYEVHYILWNYDIRFFVKFFLSFLLAKSFSCFYILNAVNPQLHANQKFLAFPCISRMQALNWIISLQYFPSIDRFFNQVVSHFCSLDFVNTMFRVNYTPLP